MENLRPLNKQQLYESTPAPVKKRKRNSPEDLGRQSPKASQVITRFKQPNTTAKKRKPKRTLDDSLMQMNLSDSPESLADPKEEPEIICKPQEIGLNVEEEIKQGFFELRQKFTDEDRTSIYVSHVVLKEKHPIFKKIDLSTIQQILLDSSILYVTKGQSLFRAGTNDQLVYFVLFGKFHLEAEHQGQSKVIGKANIGWVLGEEILFDRNLQARSESCVARVDSCVLGIPKTKLAVIQRNLVASKNTKDYFCLESVLRGNFLVKNNWRSQISRAPPVTSLKEEAERKTQIRYLKP